MDKIQHITIKVQGMGCFQCKDIVENSLLDVPGVEFATVDLLRKEVIVTGILEIKDLVKAIEDAGCKVISYGRPTYALAFW